MKIVSAVLVLLMVFLATSIKHRHSNEFIVKVETDLELEEGQKVGVINFESENGEE